ncbi:MAG: helix-turn-helix transcriptional regulator [Verrucomicrobiales bacterium]|jgi:ArsR family transcriptional regulator|nr:helix-turn-helix transcriptional regulator [Verrucomicrobiales bacterium]MBP9224752.1 helix-turn-helix transcriptional regulator [Verrucomicrobiales bacterium]HQZ27912.1 metalloregulator ArsR/SmtB family transcription factor [Verrucomicrobiales bacterium]
MELKRAVAALSSLAQESRLQIFRMLVKAGADGMPAGEIAEEIKIPANTLSFHIKELANAGLVTPRKVGRSVIYTMHPENIGDLMSFLTEDCCQGQPDLCVPRSASLCGPTEKSEAIANT